MITNTGDIYSKNIINEDTLSTNTITSDNTYINIEKGISTKKYLSLGNNNYNITTDGGLCIGNFAMTPYNDGVFKIGIGTDNNNRKTGLLFDNNGVLTVNDKIITNDLQSKNGNNIIKIYDNSIVVSKDGGTNWSGLIKSGTGVNSVIFGNRNNIASGTNSFCEGEHNGSNWGAFGERAHCEGYQNSALGNNSHAEGYRTIAGGFITHAEGSGSTAGERTGKGTKGDPYVYHGGYSHAEGYNTKTFGEASHSEGYLTTAGNKTGEGPYMYSGNYSHAEGNRTKATGESSHAEGYIDANDTGERIIDDITYNLGANGLGSHAEGHNTIAQGIDSHSEGKETFALGIASHAEGEYTKASGYASHAEGKGDLFDDTIMYLTAAGDQSHAEGCLTSAFGHRSHAEGYVTIAGDRTGEGTTENPYVYSGNYSHTEGQNTRTYGIASHAEGGSTIAGDKAGDGTTEIPYVYSGNYSHAEGYNTKTFGIASHSEGYLTFAGNRTGEGTTENPFVYSGHYSHAEGYLSKANADYSHAGGFDTISNTVAGTAIGRYNISGTNKLFVVGNGDENDDGTITRSDAFVVYNDGNVELSGNLKLTDNTKQIQIGNFTITSTNNGNTLTIE